ncbi:MAG: CRTAC1 family protein, partial [Flavobacteriaceae bacterium]
DQAIAAGIGYDEKGRARAGMGIDIADVSNDENLAIAIGNFSQEPLSLYTQTVGGLFHDRAGVAQLTRASLLQLTFGVLFTDLDNDGFVELITANGHIEPEINGVQQNITFKQSPQIFYNEGGKFLNISDQVGESFKAPVVGRGIATADIDKDGDTDVLLTVNGGSPKLFRNDTESKNHSITIQLKGKKPNQYAFGAKITLWNKGVKQNRMLRTGSSYLSQSDISNVIMGLGQNEKADSIRVTWPGSGKKTIIKEYRSGSPLVITE